MTVKKGDDQVYILSPCFLARLPEDFKPLLNRSICKTPNFKTSATGSLHDPLSLTADAILQTWNTGRHYDFPFLNFCLILRLVAKIPEKFGGSFVRIGGS